jgi:putative endonuclease
LLGSESNVLSEPWRVEGRRSILGLLDLYFVYILECRDGSFYVGSTSDLTARLKTHQSGNGPAYTARRLPIRLAYSESHPTLESAVGRERQLKGWSSAKRAALIDGDSSRLHDLSRCRELYGNLDDLS